MTVGSHSDTVTTLKGQTVPVAEFDTIDLAQLENSDPSSVQRLLDAASSSGWFYIDLANSANGKAILSDVAGIYKNADDYFMQPQDVKMQDARPNQPDTQDRGYKESQCDNTFEMSLDEMADGTISWPDAMRSEADRYKRFSNRCHEACGTIIARLGDALKLSPSERFENFHRSGVASDSALKLIYEPSKATVAEVEDNLHTDSGTLTFLFYDAWGLSAHKPGQGFGFTRLLSDSTVLINVGDSLQRFSNGKLISPKHRVTQPTDGIEKRYYLSYFVRPEEHIREGWRKEAASAA